MFPWTGPWSRNSSRMPTGPWPRAASWPGWMIQMPGRTRSWLSPLRVRDCALGKVRGSGCRDCGAGAVPEVAAPDVGAAGGEVGDRPVQAALGEVGLAEAVVPDQHVAGRVAQAVAAVDGIAAAGQQVVLDGLVGDDLP